MGLEKSHVKKENPRVHNSGLFGMIDNAESTNQMRNSEANLPSSINSKAGREIQTAMLEAEYRKTQAIALTRQMHYL